MFETAEQVDPPVVTTSSTITTRDPRSIGPSTQRWVPWSFTLLRTMNAATGRPRWIGRRRHRSGNRIGADGRTADGVDMVAADRIENQVGDEGSPFRR